jgi:hypothetical protein
MYCCSIRSYFLLARKCQNNVQILVEVLRAVHRGKVSVFACQMMSYAKQYWRSLIVHWFAQGNIVNCISSFIQENINDFIYCSVRKPADDNWLLDPVLIFDTYGASEGKEVMQRCAFEMITSHEEVLYWYIGWFGTGCRLCSGWRYANCWSIHCSGYDWNISSTIETWQGNIFLYCSTCFVCLCFEKCPWINSVLILVKRFYICFFRA